MRAAGAVPSACAPPRGSGGRCGRRLRRAPCDHDRVKRGHPFFKFVSRREWAEDLLDGSVRFQSLAYFRDYEDGKIRGDEQ